MRRPFRRSRVNRGPHPEPGLYICRSTRCRWAFIHFGNDWWQGPIWSDLPTAPLFPGRRMSWAELEDGYGDCSIRLQRSS